MHLYHSSTDGSTQSKGAPSPSQVFYFPMWQSFEWRAAPNTCSDWWKLPPPSQLLTRATERNSTPLLSETTTTLKEMKTTARKVKISWNSCKRVLNIQVGFVCFLSCENLRWVGEFCVFFVFKIVEYSRAQWTFAVRKKITSNRKWLLCKYKVVKIRKSFLLSKIQLF